MEWIAYCKGQLDALPEKPDDIPANPRGVYLKDGWIGTNDWLGTERVWQPFEDARAFVHDLELNSVTEWKAYIREHLRNKTPRPDDIPANPDTIYNGQGWAGWPDWFGKQE